MEVEDEEEDSNRNWRKKRKKRKKKKWKMWKKIWRRELAESEAAAEGEAVAVEDVAAAVATEEEM